MKKQICIISMVFAVAVLVRLSAATRKPGEPGDVWTTPTADSGKCGPCSRQAHRPAGPGQGLVHRHEDAGPHLQAQQEIAAKNIAEAKKDVVQAASLMAILKEILPTVKVIDSIQVAMANLTYVYTTEVPQDLVTITASLDQLYDLLPEGKAKEQAKQAKGALAKDKEKGAAKAKESLEAVEESLDFSEADMSVSHVSRCVKLAQEELGNGDSKEAGEALTAALDGVIFVDFDVVDPASVAAREIWLATQDWAAKSPKATKTRMEKAKAALHDVVKAAEARANKTRPSTCLA